MKRLYHNTAKQNLELTIIPFLIHADKARLRIVDDSGSRFPAGHSIGLLRVVDFTPGAEYDLTRQLDSVEIRSLTHTIYKHKLIFRTGTVFRSIQRCQRLIAKGQKPAAGKTAGLFRCGWDFCGFRPLFPAQ